MRHFYRTYLVIILGAIALVVSFMLPIESKGLDLSETGHQMTKGRMHLVNENDVDDDYGAIEASTRNDENQDTRERY